MHAKANRRMGIMTTAATYGNGLSRTISHRPVPTKHVDAEVNEYTVVIGFVLVDALTTLRVIKPVSSVQLFVIVANGCTHTTRQRGRLCQVHGLRELGLAAPDVD